MSLSVAVIDALLATGATREQIAAAVKADIAVREAEEAEKLEVKRAKARERQQQKRERDRNAMSRNVTVTARDKRDASPNERDNLTPTQGLPQDADASLPQGAKRTIWVCPPGVNPDHWRDFLKNRRTKHLTNSETAYRGQLRELEKLADDEWPPGRLVEYAAAKGWASINDPRNDYGKRPHSERPSGWETAYHSAMGTVGHG